MAFIGAARTDAKPRAGYEVAVAQFALDSSGHGSGTMAAAARVKPGGETGVRIDDYAEAPVKLTAAARPAGEIAAARRVDTRTIAVGLTTLALLFGMSRAASAARTDVIVLRNGDHITGEVEQMRQGKLVVKTDNAGTLSIEWDEVASVTTAARYDVTMRDSRRLFGRLRPAAAGSLDLVADDGGVTTLTMADIVWFAQIKNTFWDRIDGSMDLGGSYTRSSGVADVAFDVDAEYRRPSDRYSGSFSTNLTRQDQTDEAAARTTSRYSLKLNYTKFRGNQWFVAPFGLFEGNRELGFTFRGTGPCRPAGTCCSRVTRRSCSRAGWRQGEKIRSMRRASPTWTRWRRSPSRSSITTIRRRESTSARSCFRVSTTPDACASTPTRN